MPWMDWIASRHLVFVHVPVAVAFLLPWALIAAQRVGRGIRPWWITCRFLGWAGVLFGVVALATGFLQAKRLGFLAPGQLIGPKGAGLSETFRIHQILAGGSFLIGLATLRSMFRKRQDHEGLGFLSLVLGVLWGMSSVAVGFFGARLREPQAKPAAPVIAVAPEPKRDPIAVPPHRMLDFQALEPMHAEPVRNPLHGNRWLRVWASPEAIASYRAGGALPEGALVVMSTQEDRWGRPGPEHGPLLAMESKSGKLRFLYYWPRVPEARRGETGGEAKAFWQGSDAQLDACLSCHAEGLAPVKDRSTWTGLKKLRDAAPLIPGNP